MVPGSPRMATRRPETSRPQVRGIQGLPAVPRGRDRDWEYLASGSGVDDPAVVVGYRVTSCVFGYVCGSWEQDGADDGGVESSFDGDDWFVDRQ